MVPGSGTGDSGNRSIPLRVVLGMMVTCLSQGSDYKNNYLSGLMNLLYSFQIDSALCSQDMILPVIGMVFSNGEDELPQTRVPAIIYIPIFKACLLLGEIEMVDLDLKKIFSKPFKDFHI